VNYIGSKYSLLPFLERNILDFVGSTNLTLFDIFAGTGAVGRHFKKLGFRIIANDIQHYSYCLNRVYVGLNDQPRFSSIVDSLPNPEDLLMYDNVDTVLNYLNELEGVEGFVYRNYCPGGTASSRYRRQYFINENGKKCDAIRLQIEDWYGCRQISQDEYYYLLASLIEAIDKVANTASVYGAFLKHIKKSACKPLELKRLKVVSSIQRHDVYNADGSQLVDRLQYDMIYMDPPYNQRQYCTNYHVLETIARYDDPKLRGVTGLREYRAQKSDFCIKRETLSALEDLIRRTPAQHVFLSYNNEGLMQEADILRTMEKYGSVELRKQKHARFRADIDRENRVYKADSVIEYLFCLEKAGRAELPVDEEPTVLLPSS